MADIINQITTGLGSFGLAGMGNILSIFIIFFVILFIFIIIFLILWWKSFNLNVKIYEPLGQVPFKKEDIERLKKESLEGKTAIIKEKDIKFNHVNYRCTHGKYITHKGNPYFQTFMPLRKHEPIPMEFLYDNGVYMLRISKDLFVPIQKPETIVAIGENTSISVASDNRWRVWNNMMADRINNKYQDMDVQKKVTLYFVVGIVALVIIGGFILWLIYSSANRGWDAAEKLSQFASSLGGGTPPK